MAPITPVSNLINTFTSHLLLRSPADIAPTRTIIPILAVSKRQAAPTVTVTVTSVPTNNNSCDGNLSTGAVVGIVIGCVVGVLLLIWIFRSCTAWNHPNEWGEPYGQSRHRGASPQTRHKRRGSHHSHSHYDYSPPRRSRSVRSSRGPIVLEKTSASASPRAPTAVYEARRSGSRY